MTDLLLLLLPAVCDPADAAVHWWRLADGSVAELGSDERWRALAVPPTGGAGLPVVALAPVAAVCLGWPEPEGATLPQRLGVAKATALGDAVGDPSTLHLVAGMVEERIAVATVANGSMVEWIDWLGGFGVDPVAIVPVGLLLPPADEWRAAVLGSERMIGRGGLLAPDEPALREALVGEAELPMLSDDEVAQRILFLAQALPLNLRSGRFARRRLFVLDWRRVRELAALALLIPVLGLAMALIMLFRLDAASDRLEAETARIASSTLGRELTATAAVGALDARIGETPGASGSAFVPLTALYQQIQQVPGTTAMAVNWRADGTLTASLAATRIEDVNRLLLALQRAGYRVTATTRAGTGGQMIADLTLRSAE
ncbi:type II secretion system protein GspL [Sphingomonas sp. LHG3406-1]|uniref:type II secretion system protein GspL n=1 Tax=Sphingomonas sp. LHG3406-1 TaxID=2804617 RepID=UPI002614B622|nr:type II secretion system protein GspL [Sphingomonas sp. LHG3406-1]